MKTQNKWDSNEGDPITILYVRGMYGAAQDQSERINDDMTFATLYLFPGIKAGFLPRIWACFSRLAIDNRI